MHIALLFYSDTIAMAHEARSIMGRAVANNGFLEALLKFESNHQITLFVTSQIEKDFFLDKYSSFFTNSKNKIITYRHIDSFLIDNPIDTIHLLGPEIYRGLYLRNSLVQKSVPVTGMTHSLGHAPFLDWVVLSLLGNPATYDRLVCTTPTAKEAVSKMLKRIKSQFKNEVSLNTEIIPLGITCQDFQKTSTDYRHRLGINENTLILLSLGRFSYYTKADLLPLLLIYRRLKEETNRSVHLVLAGATGNENYPDILKSAVSEYGLSNEVSFFLNPSEVEKINLYQTADLFLAYSDSPQETFGLTILEAMASGLPIIASDWDGYRSLVNHESSGYLVPTTSLSENPLMEKAAPLQLDSLNHLYYSQSVSVDIEKFVSFIKDLLENDKKREEFSCQARVDAQAYDWNKIIQKYFNLWSELSEKSKKLKFEASEQFTLNYHSVFAHYSSSQVDEASTLCVTSIGKEVLAGKFPLRVYTAMEEIINIELVRSIFEKDGSGLSSLKNELKNIFNPGLVNVHIAWMVKYGLIRLLSNPN